MALYKCFIIIIIIIIVIIICDGKFAVHNNVHIASMVNDNQRTVPQTVRRTVCQSKCYMSDHSADRDQNSRKRLHNKCDALDYPGSCDVSLCREYGAVEETPEDIVETEYNRIITCRRR